MTQFFFVIVHDIGNTLTDLPSFMVCLLLHLIRRFVFRHALCFFNEITFFINVL